MTLISTSTSYSFSLYFLYSGEGRENPCDTTLHLPNFQHITCSVEYEREDIHIHKEINKDISTKLKLWNNFHFYFNFNICGVNFKTLYNLWPSAKTHTKKIATENSFHFLVPLKFRREIKSFLTQTSHSAENSGWFKIISHWFRWMLGTKRILFILFKINKSVSPCIPHTAG